MDAGYIRVELGFLRGCAMTINLYSRFCRRAVRYFSAVVVLFLIIAIAAPTYAQQTLGSLNGTVLDSSGAAIPDAQITVVNTQTSLTRKTTSQHNGFFQIFNLPIGTYDVKVSHDGFDTTELPAIQVQEASATTVRAILKVGHVATSVTVTANPLINSTDNTNGYTLDKQQIALTPLATGSFTQLAVLAPGVNAELLSGLDTNAGLGNQPIWANGQRDTSNTFHVNGVDVSNLFNGKSSSGDTSQRYNFNIGGGSTSGTSDAGAATVGGANPVGTSVYGSNGNSLPSPPPEFITELRVNTSMYDAQQGATSGAQIDVNTATGSNAFHGQIFGSFANNSLNAAPYFFNQEYQLSQQGIGAFPRSLVNPPLHRWTTGATLGGPIKKNKLFFFVGYQRLYDSDQSTGLSQFNVPSGLTDDRSDAGLTNAVMAWNGGSLPKGWTGIGPVASAIMNAKLPNGQYMIPSPQSSGTYQYGVPNVTLLGTSLATANQATAAIDYNVSDTDHLSVKYYYQDFPVSKPYNSSDVGGFPQTQENGSQVASIDNTISFGPRVNWEQTLGFARMGSYSYYTQDMSCSGDPTCGINAAYPGAPTNESFNYLPGLLLEEFAADTSVSPGLKVGPYSAFNDMGYYQNRLNPSTNLILALGKHTLSLGGGYSYTQLNIVNNRSGHALVVARNFGTFLQDQSYSGGVLDSIDPKTGQNLADRYYRTNEIAAYAQDKWQILPNLSITAGVRYDYHGGMTEKYGNIFNFDPSLYSVTGDTTSGVWTVNNSGFVVAGNNRYDPTSGVSDSTLNGRQWGISPRVGFAWAPKRDNGNIVISGGFGLYYDRGELFSYLSQPAGSTTGGPFGVTESAPLATYIQAAGKGDLAAPLAKVNAYVPPSANPAVLADALETQLNTMTGDDPPWGKTCGAIANQEDYTACPATLNFGAYDKNNVLPYSMNFNLSFQWQPTNDLAVKIGYTGNRARHEVIPIPFNEPGIATPSNPINGETATYGFQVLNQNSYGDKYYDYNSIAGEPWNTLDGGNTDLRVPYIGYSPNAALFETVGTSAYDALEAHLEKRLSHNFQTGVSYTYGKTLDEQSGIGLFFTGSNPNNLRTSYAPADFDRTHVFSANFQVLSPQIARPHSALAYIANDWQLDGIGIMQSGEPYSLYEFYGAVGSVYFGNYPTLLNPVLPIKDPKHPYSALTGNPGDKRGSGGSFIPAIDPSQLAIDYLQPGQKGIPVSTGSDPQDIYETDFVPGQRNIFRQSAQKRLDISVRKTFEIEKVSVQYQFNVFNVTNTTSLDVPQNQTRIRQNYACSATAFADNGGDNNCANEYVNYGQIVASNQAADQQSALTDLDQIPYHSGSGRSTTIPTTLPVKPLTSCTYSTLPNGNGCPNNGANFGSVTGTIGGSRMVTMGLSIQF
jgi:Carboxypeptidase regulatory-like domain/TonB dependent receptor-like, beta-barrel